MSMPWMLAQSAADPRVAWAPIVVLALIGVAFAAGTIILSLVVGPQRTGPAKSMTYESGMIPVGDARQRFNVRFYLVAVIFLVFDVEIVFFYPWATLFPQAVFANQQSTLLLVEMLIFVGILLVAYIYAWGKGVFRWD